MIDRKGKVNEVRKTKISRERKRDTGGKEN